MLISLKFIQLSFKKTTPLRLGSGLGNHFSYLAVEVRSQGEALTLRCRGRD